jgi:hypothetical protein
LRRSICLRPARILLDIVLTPSQPHRSTPAVKPWLSASLATVIADGSMRVSRSWFFDCHE